MFSNDSTNTISGQVKTSSTQKSGRPSCELLTRNFKTFRQRTPLHKIPVNLQCLISFERDKDYFFRFFSFFSFAEFSHLTSDVFLSKQVLSFIVEDNMHFLGTRSTDIRAYRTAR